MHHSSAPSDGIKSSNRCAIAVIVIKPSVYIHPSVNHAIDPKLVQYIKRPTGDATTALMQPLIAWMDSNETYIINRIHQAVMAINAAVIGGEWNEVERIL